jgi:hypothetical protein
MNDVISTTVYEISNKLKKETIPKTFVKRNNFAPMSIRYDKARGKDLNTMFGMVGQLQYAGQNNTKTLLEENELGKPIESKTKHTTIGLKTIRINKSFSRTIKKENRLTNINPIPAENILKNYRQYQKQDEDINNKNTELSRIARLVLKTETTNILNKPIIAYTKRGNLGIFKIEEINPDINKVKINKLYSLKDKTTKIKQRLWLKEAYTERLNNLGEIYIKAAKNLLGRNANAFNMRVKHEG